MALHISPAPLFLLINTYSLPLHFPHLSLALSLSGTLLESSHPSIALSFHITYILLSPSLKVFQLRPLRPLSSLLVYTKTQN